MQTSIASLDGVKIASDAGERSKDFAAAPIARFVKPNFCEFLTATARNIGNALILRKNIFEQIIIIFIYRKKKERKSNNNCNAPNCSAL